MTNITLKGVPEDLHAQLKAEASANFRTVAEEALARLQRSLDSDARNTKRDKKWVDEAIASGPEKPFSRTEFDAALQRGLQRAAKANKAA